MKGKIGGCMAQKNRLKEEYSALYPDLPDVYERLVRGEDPAAIERRLGPRGAFVELREAQAHLGIAESGQALRSLLGAPNPLPLRQWVMTVPVKNRRLAGCIWRLVGSPIAAVDTHEGLPEYPFFQYMHPEPTCLQVWLWRTYRPPPHQNPLPPGWMRPWGDVRWHPERGIWVVIELNPDYGPAVARQVSGWVHASRQASSGRPYGPPFRNREHCLTWLRKHALICVKHDVPITLERLGQLGSKSEYIRTEDPSYAAKTISRWCDDYRIDFDTEVKKYSYQ